MPPRPRILVRPKVVAPRIVVRPRPTSLVRALAEESAAPDEILDVATGPFERRIVDRPPRTSR